MGKRSNFERIERDFYPTPYEAVIPLLPHLDAGTVFDEPCCGDGSLVRHLESAGHICIFAGDIESRGYGVEADAMNAWENRGDCFITNPPWDRKILHPLITHLSKIAPTWLLFDADWMHTVQSSEFMSSCRKIVSVGRVKWIPGSAMTGKDNCAWYLFSSIPCGSPTFFGRTAKR